jgi:uncharacterized membrane protein YqhA
VKLQASHALDAIARALWSSRFVVAVAVLGSAAASLAVFYLATTDTIYMLAHLRSYADPALDAAARKALHAEVVIHVVEIVDGYLLATILLIFAMGLFELFVAPFDAARGSRAGASVLLVRDLDDLKNRLGKVVLIIMVVTFFEEVVTIEAHTTLELLWLAGGIALIAATLWLTHADAKSH